MPIEAALLKLKSKYEHVFIAFSGGVDSTVLLHAASKVFNNITAVHVNHKLQQQSDTWANHCQQFSKLFGANYQEFIIKEAPKNAESIEDFARKKRNGFFQQVLSAGDVILTAQHEDDQAETFMLQLMRGAGLSGLAAMPYEQTCGQGSKLRPLLTISKQEILDYAAKHSLKWVEDTSNQDLRFDRNFLRHNIMPLLNQRWPKANTLIARSASNLSRELQFKQQVLAKHLAEIIMADDSLDVIKLNQFEAILKESLFRAWLKTYNWPLLTQKQYLEINKALLGVRANKTAKFTCKGFEMRRVGCKLVLSSSEAQQRQITKN